MINDTFGHQAGDHVLGAVATRIRSCLRPADLAARLGGDEFAVLLDPGTGSATAAATRIADRIQDLLRLPLMLPCGAEVVVRASIGVATADAGSVTSDQLVADADAAMYRAKGSGKGRWEPASRQLRSGEGSQSEAWRRRPQCQSHPTAARQQMGGFAGCRSLEG